MESYKQIISRKFMILKFIILSLTLIAIYPVTSFSSTNIMLLGDSITLGSGGTYGGYRGYLNDLMTSEGEGFDFVGSQTAYSPSTIDPDHEGHSGWRADQIRDNIYDWLFNNPAELVALHIGTNDISQIPDGLNESVWKGQVQTQVNEVSQILDEIDAFSENATVILASIISRLDDDQKTYTTYFNERIQEMAASRINDNIIAVDMEKDAGLVYSNATGGDLSDYVHPNNFGYQKMAEVWNSAISQYKSNIPCRLDSRFQLENLGAAMEYYVDRSYALTSIPSQYLGMSSIKTPNDDRLRIDESNYLKFTMPEDAAVYVAYDTRVSRLPNWMNGFSYTGEDIYTSLVSQDHLKVYTREFYKGDCVDLGGNYAPGSSVENRSNYFVFYGALGSVPSCVLESKFQKTTLTQNLVYYSDRNYTLTSVPPQYEGMDAIITPNDDRDLTQNSYYLNYVMPSDGTVYVAYDSRATRLPNWLAGFVYTGDSLLTSLTSQPELKIYSKVFSEGDCINLGANKAAGFAGSLVSNYIVFYSGGASGVTHSLTMEVNLVAGGTTTPTAGSYAYGDGVEVAITALPANGYAFQSWTGAVVNSSSVSTTVTMDSDKIVKANFIQSSGCAQLDSRFTEATLSTGIKYYTDRDYTLTEVPSQYEGMDAILTPNNDNSLTQNSYYLTYAMPSDGTVYVAYDSRATSLPNWMAGFTYTGDSLLTSLTSQPEMNIYSRAFSEGECINLGANKASGFAGGIVSNYIVFIGGVSEPISCTPLDSRFIEATLTQGLEYYTDRTYTLTSVPSRYEGMNAILTPNKDNSLTQNSYYLTYAMPSDGTVYVAYDSRATSLPNWLAGFAYTGDSLLTSLTSQPEMNIYSRAFSEGECINLGGNMASGFAGGYISNYIVLYSLPAASL